MQLQKQLSQKRGSKIYYKYVLVIPNELIEKSELKEGDELEGEASKHQLTLKKSLK
jgi:bifunctional DNA-binding transcriptional regulator/antitoxin component of YhaV-PrlF toxin-antitoxin module